MKSRRKPSTRRNSNSSKSWWKSTFINMTNLRKIKLRKTVPSAWISWLSLVCFPVGIDSVSSASGNTSTILRLARSAGKLSQNSSETSTTMLTLITSFKNCLRENSPWKSSNNFTTCLKKILIWIKPLSWPLKSANSSWVTRTLAKSTITTRRKILQNGPSLFRQRTQVTTHSSLNLSIPLSSIFQSRQTIA